MFCNINKLIFSKILFCSKRSVIFLSLISQDIFAGLQLFQKRYFQYNFLHVGGKHSHSIWFKENWIGRFFILLHYSDDRSHTRPSIVQFALLLVTELDLFLAISANSQPHFAMAPIAASVGFAADNACRSVINCSWFTLFWIPRTKHFICLHQSAVLTGFVAGEHRRMCWHWLMGAHTHTLRVWATRQNSACDLRERESALSSAMAMKSTKDLVEWAHLSNKAFISTPPSAFFAPPPHGYFERKKCVLIIANVFFLRVHILGWRAFRFPPAFRSFARKKLRGCLRRSSESFFKLRQCACYVFVPKNKCN